jgi:hypothetical protein
MLEGYIAAGFLSRPRLFRQSGESTVVYKAALPGEITSDTSTCGHLPWAVPPNTEIEDHLSLYLLLSSPLGAITNLAIIQQAVTRCSGSSQVRGLGNSLA